MRKIDFYTAAKPAILYTLVLLLTTSLFAQTDAKKETATNASPTLKYANSERAAERFLDLPTP